MRPGHDSAAPGEYLRQCPRPRGRQRPTPITTIRGARRASAAPAAARPARRASTLRPPPSVLPRASATTSAASSAGASPSTTPRTRGLGGRPPTVSGPLDLIATVTSVSPAIVTQTALTALATARAPGGRLPGRPARVGRTATGRARAPRRPAPTAARRAPEPLRRAAPGRTPGRPRRGPDLRDRPEDRLPGLRAQCPTPTPGTERAWRRAVARGRSGRRPRWRAPTTRR